MAHMMGTQQQFWSRIQILIAVQGAVIAASYAVRDAIIAGALPLAPVLLLLGALLSLGLFQISRADAEDRLVNRALMDAGSRTRPTRPCGCVARLGRR